MKQQNFIHTSDEETAQELISLGFEQLPSNGNMYNFINCTTKLTHAYNENVIDKKKIKFSNLLII